MAARDNNVDLEEAVEILSETIERNNREVEESFEEVYGELEEHDEQIIELAQYARENRDTIEENVNEIDDLWTELEDIDDSPKYDIDFTGIENSIRYIGTSIKQIFVTGKDKTQETVDDLPRRKVLIGAGALIAGDYTNIVPGDQNSGDGLFRGGECGWDIDGFGLYGEQERCTPTDNGNGPKTSPDGNETPTPQPTPTRETTPNGNYGDEVQTFIYNEQKAVADDEFGGEDQLLSFYDDNSALNEMLTEDYTEGDVFVTENDRVYAGGGEAYVEVDGVWNDVKDGEVDGE